jgi:hypothetical protein
MSSDELDSLQELDNFYDLKQYIKTQILLNEQLFRLIYFPYSNIYDETNCQYPENPYLIFQEDYDPSNKNGVVLFREKNDEILNYETPVVLITFTSESSDDNKSINYTKIEINIICKGTGIQDLENGKSRSYCIADEFDNALNHQKVGSNDEIKRLFFDNLSLNQENCGYRLIYQLKSTNYNDGINIYLHNQTEDEWGITRESYSLLLTDSPILVGIQEPTTDSKTIQTHGYNVDIIKIMYCDINLNVSESSIIKLNDNFYKIKEILEYDDYWKCTLEVTYTAIING